jgi:hypothetical protein
VARNTGKRKLGKVVITKERGEHGNIRKENNMAVGKEKEESR